MTAPVQARLRLRRHPPGRAPFQLRLELRLAAGEITALYGPSGAGKTTVLRCLAGLEGALPGCLIRCGEQRWQDDNFFLPVHRRQVAYVFQEARLFPHLSIQENLDFAHSRRFQQAGPSRKQLIAQLSLEELLARRPQQLSAGEKQRAALARALLSHARLILMDEPLNAVDAHSRRRIIACLRRLVRDWPVPVLYVSHQMEELEQLADHLALLRDGAITASGALMELSSRADLRLAREENAATVLECRLRDHDDTHRLSRLACGDSMQLLVKRLDRAPGKRVRVRLPARDVSIMLDKPSRTSILNVFPAAIRELHDQGDGHILLRLQCGAQYFLARVTNKSAQLLGLHPGLEVFAQVKSAALLQDHEP